MSFRSQEQAYRRLLRRIADQAVASQPRPGVRLGAKKLPDVVFTPPDIKTRGGGGRALIRYLRIQGVPPQTVARAIEVDDQVATRAWRITKTLGWKWTASGPPPGGKEYIKREELNRLGYVPGDGEGVSEEDLPGGAPGTENSSGGGGGNGHGSGGGVVSGPGTGNSGSSGTTPPAGNGGQTPST